MKNIILTGAAGGFGKIISSALRQKGYSVYASLRGPNAKSRAQAKELSEMGCEILEMDITDDTSVQGAVSETLKKAGSVDCIINNAGVGVLGLQESFTPDDWKKIFDVNVFGVQRVCRAILPHFKERKSGLIVNVSSLLGRITIPFYGPYNASKWALEALSENYRAELSTLGIQVCVVEPGGYPTSFIDHLVRPSDSSRSASYGEFGSMPEGFLKGYEQALAMNPQQDPKDVGRAIANLLETSADKRPFRTIVDKLGMGDALAGYNQQLEQIESGIYSNFGIGHLLKVKT